MSLRYRIIKKYPLNRQRLQSRVHDHDNFLQDLKKERVERKKQIEQILEKKRKKSTDEAEDKEQDATPEMHDDEQEYLQENEADE